VGTISQSEKIRKLAQKGDSNSTISKKLGIRYQTVWRTLHRPYKGVIPQDHLEETGVRSKVDPLLDEEVDPNQITMDEVINS
jgi:IS30 family transposase